MASIFSKIISREIPAHIIAENEHAICILDVMPLRKGHLLVIPKKEVDKFYDLPQEDYLELMKLTQIMAKVLEKSYDCKRIGQAIIGLEVPHAHIHLVPLNEMNDLNFNQPKLEVTQDELAEIAQHISKNMPQA